MSVQLENFGFQLNSKLLVLQVGMQRHNWNLTIANHGKVGFVNAQQFGKLMPISKRSGVKQFKHF